MTKRAKQYSAREIARIFGEVLPSQTTDDQPDGVTAGQPVAPSERWYRENQPPHWRG